MQKKIIKVTTLRGMGAEIGIWAQEQKQTFTLHLFVLFWFLNQMTILPTQQIEDY